jgi:UDP-2,3-diacylglucosamine pyrophosphatase LpxH
MYDAIVISDLHLGSEVCTAKEIVRFLENIGETKRLILNGDVFDSHDFRRLKKSHWKVLSLIRKMADDIEIVWVAGNHDGPAEVVSHLLGVEVVEEYHFYSGGKKILFLHGDIFDDFINAHPVITWLADVIYYIFQKVDKNSDICRWVKRQSKIYLRCAEIIENKACEYARKMNAAVICCGHTHKAEAKDVYYNSGCWTEKPGTYLTVKGGEVELCEFSVSDT